MGILTVAADFAGQVGVNPRRVKIITTDNLATITTAGYFNSLANWGYPLKPTDFLDIGYDFNAATGTATLEVFTITISAGVITAVQDVSAGNVAFTGGASVANALPVFSDTLGNIKAATTTVTLAQALTVAAAITSSTGNITSGSSGDLGTFISFPPTAANGTFIFAAANAGGAFNATLSNGTLGQSTVFTLPDPGAATANILLSANASGQTITAGFLTVAGAITSTAGDITSGSSGNSGGFISFPATAANGTFIFEALNAGGAFNTTLRNSVMGQSSVISLPDPGAATANVLLDTGAANILAKQEFVGINEVINFGTGTWTTTRIAQGNYVKRHTPADETSIIAVDITPIIRVAAAKGFRLDSFDYIYAIAANALDAHTAVLDRIAYANNVAVSVTSIPITATLATATQANPYVTNCTVTTPAFDVTADSKYVLEITVDNAAASEYDYYGIMLRFSETIG